MRRVTLAVLAAAAVAAAPASAAEVPVGIAAGRSSTIGTTSTSPVMYGCSVHT